MTLGDSSSSLLHRLQTGDERAWVRMVDIYYPLVYSWASRVGLQPHDSADVAQEVFRAAFDGLKNFEQGSTSEGFRAWLRGITNHKLADYWRRRYGGEIAHGGSDALARMAEIEQSSSTAESPAAGNEEQALLIRRVLELIRREFEPSTFQAFWRVTVDSAAPADVSQELGITLNAVYLAKSRVLRRLRQELQGLESEGHAE